MTASFAAAAAESAVKKMDKVLVLMALPGAVDLVNTSFKVFSFLTTSPSTG